MEKESLWVSCPICEHKTRIKVFDDTFLINFPLFCPWCKKETIINIIKLKMVTSKEPDA